GLRGKADPGRGGSLDRGGDGRRPQRGGDVRPGPGHRLALPGGKGAGADDGSPGGDRMTLIGLALLFAVAPLVEMPLGPVRVKAHHLEVTHARILTAEGGVEFAAPGLKARAGKIVFDRVTGIVEI